MNAEKTFQTSNFNLLAGQPKDFGIVCNQIMVESASGVITFKTTDGEFIASVGRGYRFDSPAKIINITSSVSEVVTLTYGMGLILFNPAWASAGGGGVSNVNVVSSIILRVKGLWNLFETKLLTDPNSQPIEAMGMLNIDNSPTSAVGVPLQTHDNRNLLTARIKVNFNDGSDFNTPVINADVSQFDMARLQIGSSDTVGNNLLVYANTSPVTPLPVYNADGTIFSAIGSVPGNTPRSTILYVPLIGWPFLSLSADAGVIAINMGFCPVAWLP